MNSYTLISKKDEKKNIKNILGITFIILFIIFLFNIFINPYGEAYFKIKNINLHTITHMKKYDKLKLIEESDFNISGIVVGSSQVSRYYAEDLDKNSNYNWISFPISSSMSSEHYHYIKAITKAKNIKKILYGLDDSNVFGNYLYRGNTIVSHKEDYNLFDYFTFDTTKNSLDKIKINRGMKGEEEKISNIRYHYFNGWETRVTSQAAMEKKLNNIKPVNIRKPSQREVKYLKMIQSEFGEKIIPVVSFYYPYLECMRGKKNYETYISLSIDIFNEIWHINPKYLSEMLDNKYYYNSSHTNQEFGKRVSSAIFDEKDDFFIKLDKNNYQSVIDEMFDFYSQQDFSRFAFSKFIKCK